METVQLKQKLDEFRDIEKKLLEPSAADDQKTYKELSKKYYEMKPLAESIVRYLQLEDEIAENSEILRSSKDGELRKMAEEEIEVHNEELGELDYKIRIMLIPRDPNDDKDIIVEIRAGTGGEEAALFASDLYRMYKRYAELHNFVVEPMDFHTTELGGYKEVIFAVKGNNAYRLFKHESGVHRVQRVPETESGGRIHTSAVTVAVLPEVEDVEIDISEKDLKIDIFHSSGAGGQNVNKVATAVRMTHLPTNTVVTCQDERSQHKNREKAFRILKARLYEQKLKEQQKALSQNRKSQVGTGDRSERIRTYNFPERRVTEHRINLTLYKLEAVLNGELDQIIEPLIEEENRRMLESTLV